MPSVQNLQSARQIFETNEPRDLFYRAATALVDLSVHDSPSLSLAESLAVLLQTWNSSYYRFHGRFDSEHFHELERLLSQHKLALAAFRQRTIESWSPQDEAAVSRIFTDFERLLGPVGAAKGLHLLAPSFFPLWDRKIAAAYGVRLKGRGTNAPQYLRFILINKTQCETLGGYKTLGRNPLKALDEYNYCRFARHWM